MKRTLRLHLTVAILGACILVLAGVARAQRRAGTSTGDEYGRFQDVSDRAGLDFHQRIWWPEQGPDFKVNHYDHGTGVLVADVNNDGWMDIYFLNQDGPNGLFLGREGGDFGERAAAAGIALPDRSCSGGVFGDFDNDGDADLYVTTIRQGNLLFRNRGDGTFEDVTEQAGVGVTAHSTTATWVDLDADGWLDLYVGNQASFTSDRYDEERGYWVGLDRVMHAAGAEPDVFFHNNGDGTFSDRTAEVGIVNDPALVARGFPPPAGAHAGGSAEEGSHAAGGDRTEGHSEGLPGSDEDQKWTPGFWTTDVAVTDFDADGWPDLYVANGMGVDALYRNRGDGTLQLVTRDVLGRVPYGSFGVTSADFNNDGLLDLYVVDMHSDMWMEAGMDGDRPHWPVDPKVFDKRYNSMRGPYLQGENPLTPRPDHPWIYGNACYLNDLGTMQEAAELLGLENLWPWGATCADFDLDGWTDLFVSAGMGWPWGYGPNFFYLNKEGRRFQESARDVGLEPRSGGEYLQGLDFKFARSSRSAASLDYDNDGAADLVVNNWNDRATLFQNRLRRQDRHWIGFRLQGMHANRDGVGATVVVRQRDRIQARIVTSAGGYLSQSDPRLLFGLGNSLDIQEVEIRWPGGRKQVVPIWAVDSYNLIKEQD